MHICPTPGCPNLQPTPGRCPTCTTNAQRQRRPHGNPYNTPGHKRFRAAVLAKHPRCTCTGCTHHTGLCAQPTTTADHYPTERTDLITQGLNPNDPAHGRGLCTPCHSRTTAHRTPGGWNQMK